VNFWIFRLKFSRQKVEDIVGAKFTRRVVVFGRNIGVLSKWHLWVGHLPPPSGRRGAAIFFTWSVVLETPCGEGLPFLVSREWSVIGRLFLAEKRNGQSVRVLSG